MKRLITITLALALLFAPQVFAGTISDGSITVSGTAQGFSTVPDDTKSALICVETGAVRVGFKTALTSTTGILLNIDDCMNIQGFHDVNSFKVIFKTGITTATVKYILLDK